ncbi:hypothetical protein ANO11243_024560 [Dothideomycetidae sp. 11243]|nr:hypothetical protein ANO11243_024560 [fungal sp. No.11243]
MDHPTSSAHQHFPPSDPTSVSQKSTPRSTSAAANMPAFPPPLPPTAQPPVQIPFSDPFHNRDPFLPSLQHRRKESYGGLPATLPQPHFNDSRATLSYDQAARRRSIGSATSPSRYTRGNGTISVAGTIGSIAYGPTGPLEPPPPPPQPSYGPRNMPPPSPSSSNGSAFPPSRGPVATSPFGNHRESAPSSARHSGGMSIGSLIGNDRVPGEDRGSKPATTHNSPTFRPANSLSPKRARSTSMRSDYGRTARPLSPRNSFYSHNGAHEEQDRNFFSRPAPSPHPPHGIVNQPSFRPYQSSPSAQQTGEQPGPPRPNSQPVMTERQERAGPWQSPSGDIHNPDAYRGQLPRTSTQDSDDLARRVPDYPGHSSAPYPSQQQLDREEHAGAPRHPYAAEQPHGYDERRVNDYRNRHGPTSSPSPSDGVGFESRFRHYGGPTSDPDRDFGRHGPRRDEDGHPTPRSLLMISPELNRKEGRSSPLPQAVQGAQPRLIGPGRDPSIKNEFGRMFSGLGSGVRGSATPTGPFSVRGDTTPSRMSPQRFTGSENGHYGDNDSIVNGTSMLHKSDKDAISRDDLDSINGRATPTGQSKSNKRVKTAHMPHHHHHHQHAHQ